MMASEYEVGVRAPVKSQAGAPSALAVNRGPVVDRTRRAGLDLRAILTILFFSRSALDHFVWQGMLILKAGVDLR